MWQQNIAQFKIVLSGPLGQAAMRITGNTQSALIEIAGKDSYQTSTPELALTQQTGLNIPLNALSYWIQGLPAPDQKSTYQLNKSGHTANVKQAGWKIKYSKYKLINHIWLPTKISFHNNNTTLLLIIKQWTTT